MQETWVRSLGWEVPLEKGTATHSSILAWEIPQRSLAGYSPRGHKESDTTERRSTEESIWASQMVLVLKNPAANTGDTRDMGLIPGLERSPGGGKGNPFQCSCLENTVDRGAWQAAVHGVAKSQSWVTGHGSFKKRHGKLMLSAQLDRKGWGW